MSHTNETPNYKLPLFVDNDVPSWLGDFNEAMNELDTGMGDIKNSNVAQNIAITNLQTTVNGQATDITNLKETTADHTAAIAELHEGLDTAETELAGKAPINHASTGTGYGVGSPTLYGHVKLSNTIANDTNTAVTPSAVISYINALFSFTIVDVTLPAGLSNTKSYLRCAVSTNKKLFKFYGILHTANKNLSADRVLVPGLNNRYGVKVTNGAGIISEGIEVVNGGIYCNSDTLSSANIYSNGIAVGSDGDIYILINETQDYATAANGTFTYPACLFVADNFGDVNQ